MPPVSDILSVMIKLADTPRAPGEPLPARDREKLANAAELAAEILWRFDVPKEEIFLGTLTVGHPGGRLPLSARETSSLHPESLPKNLYAADATLLPASLGKPPVLTIMALARRIARLCIRQLAGLTQSCIAWQPVGERRFHREKKHGYVPKILTGERLRHVISSSDPALLQARLLSSRFMHIKPYKIWKYKASIIWGLFCYYSYL